MDFLLRAPVWLLMVAAIVFVGTMLMVTNRRGRAFLLNSLKEILRPAIALLLGTLAAAIVGSAIVAASYATRPSMNASGLFTMFIFGALFAITVTVPRSLPLWILIFLPCWLFRLRIPAFWRWRVAPVVGGVLNLVSAELWNRVTPIDASPERLRGLMLGYYVGATAGGVCMFAIGCIRSRRRCTLPSAKEKEEVA